MKLHPDIHQPRLQGGEKEDIDHFVDQRHLQPHPTWARCKRWQNQLRQQETCQFWGLNHPLPKWYHWRFSPNNLTAERRTIQWFAGMSALRWWLTAFCWCRCKLDQIGYYWPWINHCHSYSFTFRSFEALQFPIDAVLGRISSRVFFATSAASGSG